MHVITVAQHMPPAYAMAGLAFAVPDVRQVQADVVELGERGRGSATQTEGGYAHGWS